jgi:hypothetical protein
MQQTQPALSAGRPVGFELPEGGYERLAAVAARVGAAMPPRSLPECVSTVFQELQDSGFGQDMHQAFRRWPSYRDFRGALAASRSAMKAPLSILVLGCGKGHAGCGAAYAAGVIREIFEPSDIARLEEFDISPIDIQGRLTGLGSCDLLVTHSLVHFIPNLGSFFRSANRLIRAGGGYVMGHEPNRRYWMNPECRRVLERVRTAQKLRKRIRALLSPERYYARVRSRVAPPEPTLERRLNDILRRRRQLTSDLTTKEIRRLVDPHLPDGLDGNFMIGLEGFDWEELQSKYLPGMRPAWTATSGHMGRWNPADLSRRWQRRNAELAARYPDDGATFAVFWRKQDQ